MQEFSLDKHRYKRSTGMFGHSRRGRPMKWKAAPERGVAQALRKKI